MVDDHVNWDTSSGVGQDSDEVEGSPVWKRSFEKGMMGDVPAESADSCTASVHSANNETKYLRRTLEEALLLIQRNIPNHKDGQGFPVKSDDAETLQSVLTE
jgi:hypothetical protein